MIKPDVVNKTLGPQTYEIYQKVLDSFIEEQTRAFDHDKKFAFPWAAGIRKRLQIDLKLASKVSDDYMAFLEKVSAGITVQPKDGESILSVFELAISVLMLVNDALEDIFSLGIVTLFAALASASWEKEARDMQALLLQLADALRKAKSELVGAGAQMILDAAIAGALFLAGPVGWLVGGSAMVVGLVADYYLGPDTSDSATWGARGNGVTGFGTGMAEKYMEGASRTVRIAKPAGKICIVVGFAFDVNELDTARTNIDKVFVAMDAAMKAQDRLMPKLKMIRTLLATLNNKLNELNQKLKNNGDEWTAKTRDTLEDTMRRLNYRQNV